MARYFEAGDWHGTEYKVPTEFVTNICSAVKDHFGYNVEVHPTEDKKVTSLVWRYESSIWGDYVEYFIKGCVAMSHINLQEQSRDHLG
jgi:hypothetical protein